MCGMKICFLTHNVRQDNGGGVLSLNLIRRIQEVLHAEVTVLTTVSCGASFERAILRPNRFGLLAECMKIRRALKACDVIHAFDVFPYGALAVFLSLGLRKKIIITAVGSNSILPLYHGLYAPFIKFVYRRASMRTAISLFTKQEILKKMPGLEILVINPGVDADFFARRDGSHYDTKRYKPYIVGVGQLRWRKGYHFSIRAFAKIRERFPDLHYVIVGKHLKDDYYERLQKLIDELKLRDSVFILEDVDTKEQLVDVYKGAELFCLFSQNMNHDVEGFGLVFLEAAAAGLPVVGSKNCGVDDAVREGENGLLVATRNPDDFADAIMRILGDPALKQHMAVRSLAFAAECAWNARIRGYIDIYKKLL